MWKLVFINRNLKILLNLLKLKFIEIDCGKPREIENGIINANGYYYSSVIEYKCISGYRIRNGDYLRECNLNGKWSGIEPNCERIKIFSFWFCIF
jgi:hypothetical protein